ncbi:DUF3040 domain-containing protein [Thermomonospora cellulosilytica]|uniref:DUF3040 domain-containing protein n=1 Tax=Thermomonospora cellulosilytica TaxID=1411118 RepID=A0A7W3N2N2_9ACTN|nr:DUF3040 domain-containing protein [Thermomonospora cellulosilytica]MBA9006363.1 hypothetical protein [Thermomonospora cellulosilytica]
MTRHERAALHRIETQLGRADPELAWRLRTFEPADAAEDAPVSWRPPRVAVAVAAAIVAVMVFFLAVIVLSVNQPCSPAPSRADAPATTGPRTC